MVRDVRPRYAISGIGLLALMLMLTACGGTGGQESPPNGPASALGGSPTVTGTIANFAKGEFSGTTLEIKTGRFASGPIDVFATGSVFDDGSFSIQLPGEAEMAPRLFDFNSNAFAGEGCDISVTPASHKTSSAHDFVLYTDGQPAEELVHTNASNPNSTLVVYSYVDRDVTMGAHARAVN